ncbi:hypothetical protein BDP27DRAFT_1431979 [Rhodocollybia butyracea]|uniref:Uncharacterized protein n=1 Tax=Rhodocollybia butyracea TaxID=206335 RepID=A0A9P5TY93_9AGAR|nr:hypothetical protein BDP27DRAFT_1431979 [Rhodocollybia butyracea]
MSVPPPPPARRGLRLPSRKYKDHNGFTDKPTTLGQTLEVHEHAIEVLRLNTIKLPRQVKLLAFLLQIISTHGLFSFDTIMNTDWTKPEPETSLSVRKEIDELRKNHANLLSRIYDLNATEYLDDVEDRYRSRNEVYDEDPREWMKREITDNPNASFKNYTEDDVKEMIEVSDFQKNLYDSKPPYPFSLTSPSPAHLPSISRHNHTYCTRLVALHKKLQRAQAHEEAQRKLEAERAEQERYNEQRRQEEARRLAQLEKDRLEKKFPETIEEFDSKPKDFQNLIIKFLNAGTLQDKQLANNGWRKEDVKPLMKIFERDDRFRARVQSLFIMMPKTAGSVDPRRRIT